MTIDNKTTRATFNDADVTEAEASKLLADIETVVTPTERTKRAALLMAVGAFSMRPADVPDTMAVREWLHRCSHSTYMTGRMVAVADLMKVEIPELMEQLKARGTNPFLREIVEAFESAAVAKNTADAISSLGEIRAVCELPVGEVDAGMSEADAAFLQVSRIIAKHPEAKISLDSMPPGVPARLRAAFPQTTFITMTEEAREQLNEAIEQHKATRSKLH